MTNFGKWIQQLPPIRAALGVLFLVATAAGSIGAAGMGLAKDMTEIPERMDRIEEVTDTLVLRLGKHITQDSTTTARIFCVVSALAEGDGRLINPLDPCRRD
ncbi:hypothetical protein LCGC14_1726390 [marine sediment metagenome]|uniref:Uncharacterized protein n=1 Tax=marine sediment metagenome TaxID=412755 RepID=A0A0F9HAN4_9ZZZZ